MPAQHQKKPGIESKLRPRPNYLAPLYKGSDKLKKKVALITGVTNIYGYFYIAKAALPHMKEGAAVVNTGSITGLEGSKNLLDYSATKGAIHAFTKSLAKSLVEKGIRVNCVAPGPVWTLLIPPTNPRKKLRTLAPIRR